MDEIAMKKWLRIHKSIRQRIEDNTWCVRCRGFVTIVDYKVENFGSGFVLTGKCKNCGHEVKRMVKCE